MDDVFRYSEGESFRISDSVVACSLGPDQEEVVFLPTDEIGTPGRLSDHVLKLLGAQRRLKPSGTSLMKGFATVRYESRLLCFIVTIAGAKNSADLLSRNLQKALKSSQVRSASSIWLPLLATGDAGLSLVQSFDISMIALKQAGRLFQSDGATTIALPGPEHAGQGDLSELMAHLRGGRERATGDRTDEWGADQAASEVLSLAFFLGRKIGQPELTTELILFALMHAGTARDATRTQDRHACSFGVALKELSGSSYGNVWGSLFGDSGIVGVFADGRQFQTATRRAAAIIKVAVDRAEKGGRDRFNVEDLVLALLGGEGEYRRYLRNIQVDVLDLLDAFNEVVSGGVKMRLHNDSASSEDLLGYSAYASAISGFISNHETPVPLSVSIQAPWGAGKSSLMKMIRERLDPEVSRLDAGGCASVGLTLHGVLQLLKRKMKGCGVPEVVVSADTTTVWFNAWKYESSEQLWAGMIDAIIAQLAARMPRAKRESFYLELHLSRMNGDVIRGRVYDRIFGSALAVASKIIPFFVISIAAIYYAELFSFAWLGGSIGVISAISGVGMFLRSYIRKRREPAEFSLAPYLRVPDYSRSLGSTHHMDADLDRVMRAVNAAQGQSGKVVVFIDDLDRCSPSKVSGVVEGISMLLASDSYRCVFVIGMDPQIVAASLDCAHREIRNCLPAYERRVALGWRFMDKFIQLPFTIPSQTDLSRYVSSLGGIYQPDKIDEKVGMAGRSFVGETKYVSDANFAGARAETLTQAQTQTKTKTQTHLTTSSTLLDSSSRGDTGEAGSAIIPSMDSQDVGRILMAISKLGVVNPREMKRMANVARLYLALRNEKRVHDRFWLSPALEHYAVWIVVTIRWPDFVRWLQWGGSHGGWDSEAEKSSLPCHRLSLLEKIACEVDSFANWQEGVSAFARRECIGKADWQTDPSFFELLKQRARPQRRGVLSDAVGNGFW